MSSGLKSQLARVDPSVSSKEQRTSRAPLDMFYFWFETKWLQILKCYFTFRFSLLYHLCSFVFVPSFYFGNCETHCIQEIFYQVKATVKKLILKSCQAAPLNFLQNSFMSSNSTTEMDFHFRENYELINAMFDCITYFSI